MSLQVKVLGVLCLNISFIVQQFIYVHIPLNRLDKTVTAYYSTCYHKAWTICLVLFKELFDAIRCLFLQVCCSFERKNVHQIICVDYLLKNYASFKDIILKIRNRESIVLDIEIVWPSFSGPLWHLGWHLLHWEPSESWFFFSFTICMYQLLLASRWDSR